ncbi:MAG: hypothetical protein HQL71_08795 [Magnetococcales bacterium]|nr:hypothetical protein [Magnetococcales bacterium]
MSKKNKLLVIATVSGFFSGIFICYVINSGLGNGKFDNVLYYAVGSVLVVLVRIRTSQALKHFIRTKE